MTDLEIEALNEKGRLSDETEPRIAAVKCVAGRVSLTLKGGAVEGTTISFDARKLPYLAEATDEQLSHTATSPNGDALWFPDLDEHIAIIGLLERICGLRSLKSNVGKAGATKSPAKAAAARLNGAKGGQKAKPLLEIECNCGGGNTLTLEAHPTTCPRGRAIRRRIADGKPLV